MNVDRSEHFGDYHGQLGFEKRMEPVVAKAREGLGRIEILWDEKEGPVAYCLATIDSDLVGEVDSIFVEEDYRDVGSGGAMLDRAVDWMKQHSAKRIMLLMTVGNEDAPRFYLRHNFYPRNIIFELKTPRV